jgi:nucleoid-associated protein YgaU
MRKTLLSLVLVLASVSVMSEDNLLKEDHPSRYSVQEGDTLWDIASMFLTDAWLWPEIWHVNPDIENPHLIYPGDEIVLTYIDGEPQLSVNRGDASRTVKMSPMQSVRKGDRYEKLEPRIRISPLTSAIPAIPLDAIANLLTTGSIVEQDRLANAPYILSGTANRLIFGPGDKLYARGDWQDETSVYGIFREGRVYQDPETEEVLGFEAMQVGSARVKSRESDSDIVTLELIQVVEDVRIGDRLMPTEERRVESTFYPTPPEDTVEGVIMTVLGGVSQVGRNDVVALNRGKENGLEIGDVLAIYKSGKLTRDRIRREEVRLPAERAGLLMVFRSFDKMAYGLVLQTEEPLRVGDVVKNP